MKRKGWRKVLCKTPRKECSGWKLVRQGRNVGMKMKQMCKHVIFPIWNFLIYMAYSIYLKEIGQRMKTGYHMQMHEMKNPATVSPLVCK
jgi:hypothetical protein